MSSAKKREVGAWCSRPIEKGYSKKYERVVVKVRLCPRWGHGAGSTSRKQKLSLTVKIRWM
jgi:hypothetical protein